LVEPTCYLLVVKDENWRKSINVEFDALLRNQTWVLVPPLIAKNIIRCKWVFQLKQKVDGSIDRYKSRLVAKGFYQQLGIDFGETYNPVIKPTTVRIMLSLTISTGWPIHQIDIQNAFYMEIYLRKSMCPNHLGSYTLTFHLTRANYKEHYKV
jgi:hypothetical protein